MKKIWLISYSLDGVMAGPSIRFQRYAPYFMKRGYRLQIVTFKLFSDSPSYEAREDYDVYRVNVRIKPFARTRFISKAILLIIWKARCKARILTFSLKSHQLVLVPILKLFRSRLFYVNTMAMESKAIEGRGTIIQLWNKFHYELYKILYKRINGLVFSTNSLAEKMKHFNLNGSRIKVINNGVNLIKFSPLNKLEKKILRENLSIENHDLIVLFIGLKTERKGIKELCEAWEVVNGRVKEKSVKLFLVGDEKPSANSHQFNNWWANYKAKATEKNIFAYSGDTDIVKWFHAADVFVFPSKKEGMPNVLLEAMSCGMPVIMNNFDGYSSDYGLVNRTHILFDHLPDNSELIKSLLTVINDRALRQELGEEARLHSETNFSVEGSVDNYVNLFDAK